MGCVASNKKNMNKTIEIETDILTDEFKEELEEQINQLLINKKPICIGFIIEDKNKHTLTEKFLAICRHIIWTVTTLNLSISPWSKKWFKNQPATIHKDLKEDFNLFLTIKIPEKLQTIHGYSLSNISFSSKFETSSYQSNLIIPPAPSLQTSYDESNEQQLKSTVLENSKAAFITSEKTNLLLSDETLISSKNQLESIPKEDTISKVKRWLLDNYSLYHSGDIKGNKFNQNPPQQPSNDTISGDSPCSKSANYTSFKIESKHLSNFLSPSNPLSDKLIQNLPLEFVKQKYSHSLTSSIVSMKKYCEFNQEIYVDSNYIIHQHFHEHHHYFHYD